MACPFQDCTHRLRADLLLLGKAIAPCETLLTIDDIVYLCTTVCPSQLGCSVCLFVCLLLVCITLHIKCLIKSGNWGGRPVLVYVSTFSTPSTFRLFRTQLGVGGPTKDELEDHLQRERIPFYNYLSHALFQMGRSFDTQFLFRNLLAESWGLSKSGRDIFGWLGSMLSCTVLNRC